MTFQTLLLTYLILSNGIKWIVILMLLEKVVDGK